MDAIWLLPFLLLFPLAIAVPLLFARHTLRFSLVICGAMVIAIASVCLFRVPIDMGNAYWDTEGHSIRTLMLVVEIVLAFVLVYLSLRAKQYLAGALIIVQTLLMAWFEMQYSSRIHVEHALFLDSLSLIMALIIGIVGSLICVYAVGYMKSFHEHHPEVENRQRLFFFVMFVFLSAMFGIVFANDLLWFYFFWEITTICSFVLIGYKGDDESRNNAFRALTMNVLGGLALGVGVVYSYFSCGFVELDKLIFLGKAGALLPVVLIVFAGMVKSAQMPFSSWLLGAMVAPTPVSALLHSSTMVKAGVYAALRMAPMLMNTLVGECVALVGGITFLIASFIAVSQSDAKKILAYSTVANLGLIILCAGIGTAEAVWAGVLLIVFHAVAKGLLFLCVGVVENAIGSRDVEDMDGLTIRMPRVASMMLIGMAGMFLAPFGMLISKWAVLKAVLDAHPLFAVLIAFGGAATLFFWVKWMGKLLVVLRITDTKEHNITRDEWTTLIVLAVGTLGTCFFFPLISTSLIEPYIVNTYMQHVGMSEGNIVIMLVMLGLVMLFPLSFLNYNKKVKYVDSYLSGANANTTMTFHGSLGTIKSVELKNYYLTSFFNERILFRIGEVLTICCLGLMYIVSL